jgi:Glycosyltransferase family 87
MTEGKPSERGISSMSPRSPQRTMISSNAKTNASSNRDFEARMKAIGDWSLGTKLLAVWALLVGAFQATTLPTYVFTMALRATDFQSFHRAGAWVLGSQKTPLYPLTSFAGFRGPAADLHLCMNPPHFILALSPLALLPMRTAYLLFCVLNLLCFAATLFVLRPFMHSWRHGQAFCTALLFFGLPFVTSAVAQGTVSLVITFCLAVVITRDVQDRLGTWKGALLPGFCLSLISMKPQYLVLVGMFLLARRQWKVLVVGVGTTVAWLGASVAAMGVEPWLRYPRYLQIFTQQLDVFDGSDPTYRWVAEQMISARGVLIRVLGFSQAGLVNTVSTGLLLLAIATTAALGFRVRGSKLNTTAAWGVVMLLTLCTAGHANPTDGVTLIIPAVLGWTVLRASPNSFAWMIPMGAVGVTIVSYTTLGIQHRGSLPVLGVFLMFATLAAVFGNRTRAPFRRLRSTQPTQPTQP